MRSFFLLLPVLLLTACGATEEDLVNIRLTMDERERIDKMVTAHMDSIRPILDSLCQATFADRVAIATDSIVQRRLEEEARLRARIPQNLRDER